MFQSSEHWRREAEDSRRIASQLEQEKNRAIQQRDEALHQIEHMRQLLIHNVRLLPSDQDLMKLSLDEIRSFQARLQQELAKLTKVCFRLDFVSKIKLSYSRRSNKRNSTHPMQIFNILRRQPLLLQSPRL